MGHVPPGACACTPICRLVSSTEGASTSTSTWGWGASTGTSTQVQVHIHLLQSQLTSTSSTLLDVIDHWWICHSLQSVNYKADQKWNYLFCNVFQSSVRSVKLPICNTPWFIKTCHSIFVHNVDKNVDRCLKFFTVRLSSKFATRFMS